MVAFLILFLFQLKVKAERQDNQPHDGERTEPPLPAPPAVPDLPMTPKDVIDDVEPMTQDEPDIKPSTSACALDDLFSDTFITKVEPAKPVIDRANEEILAYKSEPVVPLSDNPLLWWKERELRYPLLANVAKYYLCIPATSVPSERVFSKAGQVVNDRRASIKPKHVDYLVFLNKNMA